MKTWKLPKNWSWVKLGDFCKTTSGGTPSRSRAEYYNGEIPWVKSGELRDRLITEIEESITSLGVKESSAKIFPEGTLLIALYGATVGKVGILSKDAATNQAACAIFPNGEADRDYLFYFLQHIREDLLKSGIGGAQPNISQEIVREIEVPLPPLEEQQWIASLLSEATQARRVRRYAQGLSDDFLQEVFVRIFGDPVTNSMRWQTQALDEHIDFMTTGSRGWAQYYSNSGALFIRVQNLRDNTLNLDNVAYVSPPDTVESRRTKIQPGDLLIAATGAVGLCAIAPQSIGDAYVNQHVAIVRLRNGINKEFVAGFIAHPRGGQLQLEITQYGETRPGLGFKEIKSIEIPVPPTDLQEKYAHIAQEHTQIRDQQAESTRQSEHLFQSLLHRAFRGEL